MAFDLLGFVSALGGHLSGHPDHPHTRQAQGLVAKAATLVSGTTGASGPAPVTHAPAQVDLLQEALSLVLAASPLGPVAPLVVQELVSITGGN